VFLGHSVARQQNVSEETSKLIDSEIKAFVNGANDRAKQILTDYNDDLHTLANALLEYETLSGDEIKALLAGEEIRKNDKTKTPPKPPAPASTVPTSGGANLGEPQPEA
jgi:cell division protease FtsH